MEISRLGFEAESHWGEKKDEEVDLHRACECKRRRLEELDRDGKLSMISLDMIEKCSYAVETKAHEGKSWEFEKILGDIHTICCYIRGRSACEAEGALCDPSAGKTGKTPAYIPVKHCAAQ